ncbi:MAG: hypothetical protein J0M15_13890 [Deltaproteobacteria bacterium]|nr:hypothetical protein [Deltaproteobacteria bacterium]
MQLKLVFIFLMTMTIFTSSFGEVLSKKNAVQKLSSVEIQWEDYKEATKYQVQVFNSKNKFLKTFESKTSLLKFKSTSGKVKIRGRFLNTYGHYSQWSEFINIEVPPESVEFNKSADINAQGKNGIFAPLTAKASNLTLKGKLKLEWPESAQTKKYKLKIYDKDKKLVQELISKNPNAQIELDAGEFEYSITSIGNDDILGKEIFSPQKININAAQLPDILFKVESSNKNTNDFKILIPKKPNILISGKLEYSYHLEDKWEVIQEITKTAESWSPGPNLKPGKYKISFWGKKVGWQNSIPFNYEFVIKPTEESIESVIKEIRSITN